MPAYIIAYRESPVRDEASDAEYSHQNRENAAGFHARFGIKPLAVYGKSEAPEGNRPDGVVILEFPTYDDAQSWYASPAYQRLIPLRQKAADWRVVIVEGLT
jgi:uncharacterized protein (DUF1330 family)